MATIVDLSNHTFYFAVAGLPLFYVSSAYSGNK
jgi:hypothetical protein